jgi:hypothetical protein
MNDEFKFDDIAGQPATLEINSRDSHCVITWGDLTISDMSGEVGFWRSFHKKPLGTIKGAALQAALRKHAREMIESEIYEHIKFLQDEAASCT